MPTGIYERKRSFEHICCVCGKTEGLFGMSKIGPLCHKHMEQFRNHGRILNKTRFDKNDTIDNGDGTSYVVLRNNDQEEVGKTLVDTSDVEFLTKHKWHISKGGYIMSSINGKKTPMHRFLMSPPKGMDVDHINGDRADNRKCNLRVCSRSENLQNKHKANSATGHLGVYWAAYANKYRVTICDKSIGYFENLEDAVKARRKAEQEMFGEFAPNHNYDIK